MSWRVVVITGNAKLDFSLGYLVVRKEETTKIFLDEIGTLLIDSVAVSLTTYLVKELVDRKILVIMCDEKHNPLLELVPYYGCHNSPRKIQQQIAWNSEAKIAVWTAIVRSKIDNQRKMLESLKAERETGLLEGYLKELQPGDPANREGLAAKVYFGGVFGSEFSREGYNAESAALDYGYTILLSAFNREIVCAGFLTQLGLCHDSQFNKFNLSSDLMEPFRPIIDSIVMNMSFEEGTLEKKHRLQLIDSLNKDVVIDGKRQVLHRAVAIYCSSVFSALENADAGLIKFYDFVV